MNEGPLILIIPMESYHKYETTSIDMSIPYEGTDLKSQTQLSILGRTGSESISNTIRIGSSTNQNLEIIPTFAGSNYKVGDIGDFSGSVEGNYAKYEVLSINSTGGITKFRFINEGFGYILGETLTLRGNGSGDAQITLEENNIRVSLDNDINTGYLSGGFFINVEPNLICNKSTDTSQFGDNKEIFGGYENTGSLTDPNWAYQKDPKKWDDNFTKKEQNIFNDISDKYNNIYPFPAPSNDVPGNQGACKMITFYKFDRKKNAEVELFGRYPRNFMVNTDTSYGQFLPCDFSTLTNYTNNNILANKNENMISVENFEDSLKLLQQNIMLLPMEQDPEYDLLSGGSSQNSSKHVYVSNIRAFGINSFNDNTTKKNKAYLKYSLVVPIITNEKSGRNIIIYKLKKRNLNQKNEIIGDTKDTWNNVRWSRVKIIYDSTNNPKDISFHRTDINTSFIQIQNIDWTGDYTDYVNNGDVIEIVNSQNNDGRYVVYGQPIGTSTVQIKISEPKTYNWSLSDSNIYGSDFSIIY